MTAPAERAVHGDLAGVRSKAAEDFADHDRHVHARRRPAGREDPLHVLRVPLGVQFLVPVVKRSRALARVASASRVHGLHVKGPLGHTPFYRGPPQSGRRASGLGAAQRRVRGILVGMPPATKLSKSERAAARLKKKKSGPSAVKRAAARQALQSKKPSDDVA